MYPDKSSLSIKLTEPVVPLRSIIGRTSRRDSGILPPAIVRGLLTLKLSKPTKVSSIELELQAKADIHYMQCAGPSRIDVSEQNIVHSASTVVFKAAPLSQERRRATSTMPRVQFLADHTGSSIRPNVGPGHWQAPSHDPVPRSTSLDPSLQVRRRYSSDGSDVDDGSHPRQGQPHIDPAPPYLGPIDRRSILSLQSVASSLAIAEPQSPGSPDPPQNSPTRDAWPGALSRSSGIEQVPEDESASFDSSRPSSDTVAYYGLSRIAASSSSRSSERFHRGRSHSRFSFGKVVHVFEAVKDHVRSRSPRAGSLLQSDDEERGRSLTKGNNKAPGNTDAVLLQIETVDSLATDGANDWSGDGWVMFPEGTYTYPVFFTIPNNSPPTMTAEHGSLVWKVKAEVKHPGVFKSKMTAQREVIVICVPKDDGAEEEGIDLQQQWEGQLQYRVQIGGRDVPIGGEIPLQLTIMPMAKVKVHSISVYLDERTEYYTRTQSLARSDALRRTTLLVIRHNHSDEGHSKPILPLTSDEPDAFRKSPLYSFLWAGEDESEIASSFMGPGPWTIRHQLKVPDSCSTVHSSNQVKGSNVMVNHTLRLVLRVEKEEGSTTEKKKLFDIVIYVPVQILSCYCTSEWTSLPRYDEILRTEGDWLEDTSSCPCRARRRTKARTPFRAIGTRSIAQAHATSLQTANSNLSDSLISRTHLHERLMSGMVSETGEAPPSYEGFEATHV